MTGLTVGCGRFGPVQRADYDEAEALALLSADADVTGLRVGGRRPVRSGSSVAHVGAGSLGCAVPISEVAARGAVLRGHGARALAVLRTRLACRGRWRT